MVRSVSVRDKIRKFRKSDIWKLSDDEKVGVVNGLVMLGAVSGALLSISAAKDAHAAPTCDENGEVTASGEASADIAGGLNYSQWGNHCWWDHSWNNNSWPPD